MISRSGDDGGLTSAAGTFAAGGKNKSPDFFHGLQDRAALGHCDGHTCLLEFHLERSVIDRSAVLLRGETLQMHAYSVIAGEGVLDAVEQPGGSAAVHGKPGTGSWTAVGRKNA